MRASLKLVLLGIALPGALTPALYATLSSDDDPDPDAIRVRAVAEPRVEIDGIDVEALVTAVETRTVIRSGERCEVGREVTLRVEAGSDDLLDVEAGSGSLAVRGVEGLSEVRVTARLCASEGSLLEGLDATLDRDADRVRLRTYYPDRSGWNGWGDSYARVDLTVEVPRRMAVDVEDSSGSMELRDVGPVRVDDGSGSIEVRGADGPVRIEDGSGSVRLRDVGAVEIEDGSGSIDVRDAAGAVVLSDGSGSIDVVDVAGDVRVRRDGSGSIEVSEITGDLVVERDGSGSIRYSRVDGRVDIPEKHRRP